MNLGQDAPPLAEQKHWPKAARICTFLVISVAVCTAIGAFAVRLNARYYSSNQPFYDSLSYNDKLDRAMTACRESGLPPAIKVACTDDTVCLPFLIASFVGLVCAPSRMIGIWIQTGELMLLVWSLYYYLTCVRRLPGSLAAFSIAPFLLLRCLYSYRGGLSDFRMDLGLMLLFSVTCCWYLIASATGRRLHFALLGVACGLTCLSRGTAPVYFLVSLGPLALVEICRSPRRREFLGGIVLATSIAVAIAGWFYVLNFRFLYYYYVIWNPDANAHLPIHESLRHFRLLQHHFGAALFCAVIFQLIVATDALLRSPIPKSWRPLMRLPKLNWQAAWLALAPTGMLVARGAGLNPFVCMPSLFGCLLFLLFPLRRFDSKAISWPARGALLATILVCSVLTVRAGWIDHEGESPLSMAAHKQTIDTIVSDARERHLSDAHFSTTDIFFLETYSLENVARFDIPDAKAEAESVAVDSVRLTPVRLLNLSADADWKMIPGHTEQEKLDYLIDTASKQLDYLIIPSQATAALVQKDLGFYVINRYQLLLRQRFLASGRWQPISGDIRNRDDEVVRVYRRVDLTAAAHSPAQAAVDKTSPKIARAPSGAVR